MTGVDLAPTQPSWVPANCKFEMDDASQMWTFPDNTFDYIHLRFMLGCFEDWVQIYRECFRCLKPGGWIEHQDYSVHMHSDDGSLPAGSVWEEWASVLIQAGQKMGKTIQVIDDDNFVRWIEQAGFRQGSVQTSRTKMPMGSWPASKKWKAVGEFNRLSYETSLEGYGLYLLTNVLGWEYAAVQAWMVRMRQGLEQKDWHAYSYL